MHAKTTKRKLFHSVINIYFYAHSIDSDALDAQHSLKLHPFNDQIWIRTVIRDLDINIILYVREYQ